MAECFSPGNRGGAIEIAIWITGADQWPGIYAPGPFGTAIGRMTRKRPDPALYSRDLSPEPVKKGTAARDTIAS